MIKVKNIWENGKTETEWENGTYLPDKYTFQPGEAANPAEFKVVEVFCNEVFYTLLQCFSALHWSSLSHEGFGRQIFSW